MTLLAIFSTTGESMPRERWVVQENRGSIWSGMDRLPRVWSSWSVTSAEQILRSYFCLRIVHRRHCSSPVHFLCLQVLNISEHTWHNRQYKLMRFFHFRQLRVHRIILHQNLFISMLINGILVIFFKVIMLIESYHTGPSLIEEVASQKKFQSALILLIYIFNTE